MRILFDQPTGEALNSSDLRHKLESHTHESTDQQHPKKFVRLEIRVEALQRLINQKKLTADEVRCLNKRTKRVFRQALLDSLMRPDV